MAANANPFALLLGDSWFWYPVSNLAVEIGAAMPEHQFIVAGSNGANAGDWGTKLLRSTDFTLKMYASGVRALFLSGGGNEIAVFTHNYDHCWPTGKGIFGPGDWLKRPMDLAEVPEGLRRDLFKDLLDRLIRMQQQLAKEPGLMPLVPIVTAGTLPDKDSVWANELHPTRSGFKLLARKAVVPALQNAMAALLTSAAPTTTARKKKARRAKKKRC